MRNVLMCGVGLTLSLVAIGTATAQERRGGDGFGRDRVFLLDQESVQKELKVTAEQKAKVSELAEKQRNAFEGARDLSREERQKRFEERRQENDKALADLLTPEQKQRLEQISLQVRGARALLDPEVADKLKLTDDQRKKIEDINRDAGEDMRALFQDGGDPAQSREKREAITKTANEKAQQVLTDDQRTAWKQLAGAAFTGEIQFRGGGRRGPGGEAGGRPKAARPKAEKN